jgi:hypothetical protein
VVAPKSLGTASKPALQSIFLTLFSLIQSVGYFSSPASRHHESISSNSSYHADLTDGSMTPDPPWEAMRAHVCEMLAHHLILIGSRLGVYLDHGRQKNLLPGLAPDGPRSDGIYGIFANEITQHVASTFPIVGRAGYL